MVTTVLEAQEEALEVINNGEIVRMIALDQSAAFDVIEHSILRRKMELYGFDPHSLSWFCSYMKDRSQYVYLETSVPEVKVVRPFACPKGSCLGPLLWNLYCGEVSEIKPLSTHVAGEEEIIRGGRKEVSERWKLGNLLQYADDLMIMVSYVEAPCRGCHWS